MQKNINLIVYSSNSTKSEIIDPHYISLGMHAQAKILLIIIGLITYYSYT